MCTTLIYKFVIVRLWAHANLGWYAISLLLGVVLTVETGKYYLGKEARVCYVTLAMRLTTDLSVFTNDLFGEN